MSERPHARLDVWKRSIDLVTEIYVVTDDYPAEEKFGLVSQMRKSAVSIPSNIAEGAARQTTKEYTQFLYIARGSLSELDTQAEIARNLKYIKNDKYAHLIDEINEISRMLSGLINSLERRK